MEKFVLLMLGVLTLVNFSQCNPKPGQLPLNPSEISHIRHFTKQSLDDDAANADNDDVVVVDDDKNAGHHHRQKTPPSPTASLPNFVSTLYQSGGVREELRLSYHNVMVLETLIPSIEEAGSFARQVSNGQRLVQLIYLDSDTMVDCNVVKDGPSLAKFMRSFLGKKWKGSGKNPLNNAEIIGHLQAMHGKNTTIEFLGDAGALDEKYSDLIDLEGLIAECREQHHAIREDMKLKNRLGHYHPQRKSHHKDAKDEDVQETSTQQKETHLNATEQQQQQKQQQQQQQQQHHRAKRFIYPGTNWCGKGDRAEHYNDLGEKTFTDRCCRTHDNCPHYIEGFTTKYDRFNFGLHTMSSCHCDRLFRRCLREVEEGERSTADFVGNIFFNVMGNSCFKLTKRDVCVKRSWWGSCIKSRKKRSAKVRRAITF